MMTNVDTAVTGAITAIATRAGDATTTAGIAIAGTWIEAEATAVVSPTAMKGAGLAVVPIGETAMMAARAGTATEGGRGAMMTVTKLAIVGRTATDARVAITTIASSDKARAAATAKTKALATPGPRPAPSAGIQLRVNQAPMLPT